MLWPIRFIIILGFSFQLHAAAALYQVCPVCKRCAWCLPSPGSVVFLAYAADLNIEKLDKLMQGAEESSQGHKVNINVSDAYGNALHHAIRGTLKRLALYPNIDYLAVHERRKKGIEPVDGAMLPQEKNAYLHQLETTVDFLLERGVQAWRYDDAWQCPHMLLEKHVLIKSDQQFQCIHKKIYATREKQLGR